MGITDEHRIILQCKKKCEPVKVRITCDPDWIQTNDLLLRRQLLYSTELPDHLLIRAQIYQFRAN